MILYNEKHTIFEANEIMATYNSNYCGERLHRSDIVYEHVVKDWPNIDFEERMYVIMVNSKNQFKGMYLASIGSSSGTIADPKKIIGVSLACNAMGIIILHNHPSGCSKPSHNDNRMTNKLNHVCNFLDLTLLDHIIVTKNSYYSYAENEKLIHS